jgi:Family of unknown function (DUF5675)
MQYKILIVKNHTKEKLKFEKCYEWFQKNMGLTMSADEITTDFTLTTKHVGNATWKGVVAGDDLTAKLRSVVPANKYHAVVFVYGDGLDGIRVSCCNGGSDGSQYLYENTEVIQLVNTDWKTLNHELFHALFAKANRFGAKLYDPMDTYYRDSVLDLDQGQTSRTVAVRNLLPFLPTITTMQSLAPHVVITRTYTDKETFGELVATNGGATFTCKTLELPWKNNQRNVSCIPAGWYTVDWSFSASRMKYTYRIKNVTGRSGILIHVGNFAAGKKVDIEGCILVGNAFKDLNNDSILDIANSTVTLKALEGFLGKKSFTLQIK